MRELEFGLSLPLAGPFSGQLLIPAPTPCGLGEGEEMSGCMFPRKPHKETPIERIFREVAGRKMNQAERRYFLHKRKREPH
jgi:hypothetical protein